MQVICIKFDTDSIKVLALLFSLLHLHRMAIRCGDGSYDVVGDLSLFFELLAADRLRARTPVQSI